MKGRGVSWENKFGKLVRLLVLLKWNIFMLFLQFLQQSLHLCTGLTDCSS
jgi:hypothetical protein